MSQYVEIQEQITEGLKKNDEEMLSICLSIVSKMPAENPFASWTATDKHKSKLIHILVNKKMPKTIRELAPFLDFNAARSTDQVIYACMCVLDLCVLIYVLWKMDQISPNYQLLHRKLSPNLCNTNLKCANM
jgi:hypothetical protein